MWHAEEAERHKVRTYKEYHSVCPSSELGLPPTPQPQSRCPLPPVSGGRGTLAGEKGVGRVPILTRGIHCGSLYMYVLCAEREINEFLHFCWCRHENNALYLISKGGRADFFKSLQIANPPILGLNPYSQIRKFLRYASPQISNLQMSFN